MMYNEIFVLSANNVSRGAYIVKVEDMPRFIKRVEIAAYNRHHKPYKIQITRTTDKPYCDNIWGAIGYFGYPNYNID